MSIDLSTIGPETVGGIALVVLGLFLVLVVRRRRRAGRVVPSLPEEAIPGEEAPAPEMVGQPGEASVEAHLRPLEAPPPAPPAPSPSPYDLLRRGLRKTRQGLLAGLAPVLGRSQVDARTLEEIEEALIVADVGTGMTARLVGGLRARRDGGESVREHLERQMVAILESAAKPSQPQATKPWVIVVVGVNGVGKTTSIGKLAMRYRASGKRVLLVAGDTFRAAAIDQLAVWGDRAEATVVRAQPGSDPGAVVHDGLRAAIARDVDVVIVDTAGRLHTKSNLMEELRKVRRVIAREVPGAPHETLLVLDAVTGQNGVVQARAFVDAVEVTGVILSKLDGTAKGGVVLPIAGELGLPIRYVGIGEGVDDLREFDPRQFVSALLGSETHDSLDT